MKLPRSIKGRLSLLIKLAEDGNCLLTGSEKLTREEDLLIGALIADIQNNLGEMQDILSKFRLQYNGGLL